jgi:recombination protein RecT
LKGKNMATAIATLDEEETRSLSPEKEVQSRIAKMGAQLRSVLPAHIEIAKFQRVAMTAITMDPALLNADRQSLYTSLTKAAMDGLLPDKREGALVIYKTKVKIDGRDEWIEAVQWMPMVAGILKKVRQSGEVASIAAHAVYENDEFDYTLGDNEQIHHKPTDGPPGRIRGAYCIVTLKDGFKVRDYMPWWRIEKAKAAAKTKYVWDAWPDEMAIKTVIKHIAKVLPQSTDIEAAFEHDDTAQFEATAALLGSRTDAPPAPLTGQALLEQASDQPATGTAEAESINTAEEVAASVEEGKPDEERGEAMTLAHALDEILNASEVRDVNRLVSAHLQTFSGAEADEIRNAGAERCDAILRAA